MRAALGSLSTGRLYSSAVDIVSRLRARRLVAEITSYAPSSPPLKVDPSDR